MKSMKTTALLLASSLFVLASCGSSESADSSFTPVPGEVSFPGRPEDSSYSPGPDVNPSEGDPAVPELEIEAAPAYFDNDSLHEMAGQWNGYGIHHPSVFRFDGSYYLYQSTPSASVGIRAFKSKDLIHWDFATKAGFPLGYVTKDKATYGAQAPQVIRVGDEFLLYFKSAEGYVVFSSDSPEGPFAPKGKLNFDSNYLGHPFLAPNGKLFMLLGGAKAVEIYEMPTPLSIDASSRTVVQATALPAYAGAIAIADSPFIADINGTAYLTYSSQKEHLVSYRSYLVSAINPDYSSSQSLADSFFQQGNGPLLLNADEMNGSRGLGDVQIVQGPDLSSYCAVYTSYMSSSVRRCNFAPIALSGANISIAHRDQRSFFGSQELISVPSGLGDLLLSEKETGAAFTASFCFENAKSVYFGYKTKNNHYRIDFDDENRKASFYLMENGLETELGEFEIVEGVHEVEICFDDSLSITIDGRRFVSNMALRRQPQGKIGYGKDDDAYIGATSFVNSSSRLACQSLPKMAESTVYAGACLQAESRLDHELPLGVIDDDREDLYGSLYLNLSSAKDYARFALDVKEAGRYGVEITYNASFGNHRSTMGIRLGEGDELIYKTHPIGERGYVRTITVETDAIAGVNELLIENLSSDLLRIVSVRLVKVSSDSPLFNASLEDYADKGIFYVTDFRLNASYKAHETYEGARCFAYVGDGTITDFTYSAEIGFLGGVSTSGFVSMSFRCSDFASSSYDNDESLIGYSLEVSQYQTRLVKHNYGYGETLGVLDLPNTIGDFRVFKITMESNLLKVYRDETLLFSHEDPTAFSAGHLGFGSNDTNGLIRKLNVTPAEE